MRNLVIIGTAGNSLEILDTIIHRNRAGLDAGYNVIGFLDDDASKWNQSIHGVPVLGGLNKARDIDGARFVNGIGSTRTFRLKPQIIENLALPEDRFASIVHPSAVISNFATIGAGTVILQNAVICSNTVVGRHVHVLPLTVLSHDAVIEDYATIAGCVAVSGNVIVGRASYIGTNASIRGDVRIGAEALVGMGAVVLNDVEAGSVVAGVPAAPLSL